VSSRRSADDDFDKPFDDHILRLAFDLLRRRDAELRMREDTRTALGFAGSLRWIQSPPARVVAGLTGWRLCFVVTLSNDAGRMLVSSLTFRVTDVFFARFSCGAGDDNASYFASWPELHRPPRAMPSLGVVAGAPCGGNGVELGASITVYSTD
jgi:hypothetical protein